MNTVFLDLLPPPSILPPSLKCHSFSFTKILILLCFMLISPSFIHHPHYLPTYSPVRKVAGNQGKTIIFLCISMNRKLDWIIILIQIDRKKLIANSAELITSLCLDRSILSVEVFSLKLVRYEVISFILL